MSAVIAARGLRRTYGHGKDAFEAVKAIDLDVAVGEVFALLGINGAGKTSTFDLLEGLAAPGVDVSPPPVSTFRAGRCEPRQQESAARVHSSP